VVGDDDQSIYSWRGADVDNIHTFTDRYPAARVIKLEQNYRSSGNILQLANAVIGAAVRPHAKQLWTAAGAGAPVEEGPAGCRGSLG
jgi:DNA helicase-2/ATP-dependent DNA helicase PcrA